MARRSLAHVTRGMLSNVQIQARGVHVLAAEIKPPIETLTPRVVFRGDPLIETLRDHIIIGPIGSRSDYLTVCFKPDLIITTGCFTGSIDDFREEVSDKWEPHKTEYLAALAFIEAIVVTRRDDGEEPIAY